MKTDSIKTTCMQTLPQQMKTPTHLSESLSWQRRVQFKATMLYSKTLFELRNPDGKKKLKTVQRSWTLPWESPLSHDPVNSSLLHQRQPWTHCTHTEKHWFTHTLAQAVTHTGPEDDGGVTGNHSDRTAASCRCVFSPFIHVPLHEKSQGLATHCKLVQRC